jgi:hypothetical protein
MAVAFDFFPPKRTHPVSKAFVIASMPKIAVDKHGEPAGPALHPTPQYDQLMPEDRIFCLKSGLRLEWRGQNCQHKAKQSEHDPQTLGDSFI